jgi:alpha-tubulin suppressor-like RCC1 family protein
LYTWGDDSFGQLGLNNGELICTQPKKIVLNEIFHVSKVQCGKFFTAGITSDGIVFKFGSKYKNNLENEFNYDFNKNFYNNNNWNFDINNNDFNCDLNNENENKRKWKNLLMGK